MGKKIMPLMAVLLLVALVESCTVTVYNTAKILVNALVDDKNVRVETDITSLDLTPGDQIINFNTGQGDQVMSVNVKGGDVLVLVPEPFNGGPGGRNPWRYRLQLQSLRDCLDFHPKFTTESTPMLLINFYNVVPNCTSSARLLKAGSVEYATTNSVICFTTSSLEYK